MEITQAQVDALNTSIGKLEAQVAPLKGDNDKMVSLIVDLRASLATALAAGQAPTPVDLTAAIASIDSVTATLSASTTTDDAVLNPPAVVVPPPPAPPAPPPSTSPTSGPSALDPTGMTGANSTTTHVVAVDGTVTTGTSGNAPTTPVNGAGVAVTNADGTPAVATAASGIPADPTKAP